MQQKYLKRIFALEYDISLWTAAALGCAQTASKAQYLDSGRMLALKGNSSMDKEFLDEWQSLQENALVRLRTPASRKDFCLQDLTADERGLRGSARMFSGHIC
jgi:hypothetical protein